MLAQPELQQVLHTLHSLRNTYFVQSQTFKSLRYSKRVEKMKNRIGSNLFREKLNNVLKTPQGKEIKGRNNRISDKFQGGYLKGKDAGLKIKLEPPAEIMDDLATLTKIENENKPLLSKLPPSSFLNDPEDFEEDVKPFYKEDDANEELETVSSEEEYILVDGVTKDMVIEEEIDSSFIAMDIFKTEFNEMLQKKDYFNALVVLITATLVVIYTFIKECAQELSFLAEFVINRRIGQFFAKEKEKSA